MPREKNLVSCNNCNKVFHKVKSQVLITGGNYCSRRCAAIINNQLRSRGTYLQRKNKCKTCDNMVKSGYTYCHCCWENKTIDWTKGDMTLEKCSYKNCHKSVTFAKVRSKARSIGASQNWSQCKLCGYDKHIEVAHIIPLKSFPLDTPLSVVNALTNLCPLCPNCHWEFDNGLIILEG